LGLRRARALCSTLRLPPALSRRIAFAASCVPRRVSGDLLGIGRRRVQWIEQRRASQQLVGNRTPRVQSNPSVNDWVAHLTAD